MSMKFYLVLEDGTLEEEKEFNQESTRVIIVVDDQFKRIFLWKGANSGIKKKFIGSRAAAELRKTYYGFAYRLSVVEEGDETNEFEFTIKRSRGEATVGVVESGTTRGIPTSPSTMGLETNVEFKLKGDEPGKKIIYTDKDTAATSQFAGSRAESKPKDSGPRPKRPETQAKSGQKQPQRQRTILSEMMSGGQEPQMIRPAPTQTRKPVAAAKPVETVSPPPTPTQQPSSPPPQPASQKMTEEVDLNYAFKIIKELGVPAGYERDLVIVGTGVYKQQGNEFLVPPDPPEGVFLAPDRVPRIVIENGVVKVIEVLKKLEKVVKKKEEDVQLDQGIEDLMSTFQIEIE